LKSQYKAIKAIHSEYTPQSKRFKATTRAGYVEMKEAFTNAELQKLNRLAMCVPSVVRLAGSDPWDLVLYDEARMTLELLNSDLRLHVRDITEALTTINGKARLRIIASADLDPPTLQTLCFDTDLHDPRRCIIIDNIGGKGGLNDVQSYFTTDLDYAVRCLLHLVNTTDFPIYIPTNQRKFVFFLRDVLLQETSLQERDICTITSLTNDIIKAELIEDCRGYFQKHSQRVVIVSPTFGTGFSIDKGYIKITFGFMFQYPPNTHDCVQQLARAREVESLFIYTEKVNLGQKVYFKGKMYDTSWFVQKVTRSGLL
jgi:hypothetical protein